MTERWRIAKHCHIVLSELLENMRGSTAPHDLMSRNMESAADGQPANPNVRAGILESNVTTSEQQGMHRASKRRRLPDGGSDWSSSAGHFPPSPRRNYTDGNVLQPQNVSATFSTPEIGLAYTRDNNPYHRQTHPNVFNPMEPPEQPDGGRLGYVQSEARNLSTPPSSSGDRYPVQPSYGSSILLQPVSANTYIQHPEQSRVQTMTAFPNVRGGGWQSNQSMTANNSSDPVFDVFDGATWGSLLELMDTFNGKT